MASVLEPDPMFPPLSGGSLPDTQWQSIQGFQVCSRGFNNMKCEEVASDIKKNRLLPRLIAKQVSMLYGHGLAVYKPAIVDGKLQKQWVDCPEIMDWLNSWEQRSLESGYKGSGQVNHQELLLFQGLFRKVALHKGEKQEGTMPVCRP